VKVSLEDFVPHPQSLRWRLADAYYEAASITAWTSGSVPYRATSNHATARQHALVVTSLFRELEQTGALAADEPFVVLEIGSGLGQFAENFLAALDGGCGADGRRLRARIRYLFSDRNPNTVREATGRAALVGHVVAGRIVQTVFDLRRPDELFQIDGSPLPLRPSVVLANYVCCVSPPTVIRRRGETYLEQHTALSIECADENKSGAQLIEEYLADPRGSKLLSELAVDSEWREIDLATRFPSGPHAATIVDALAGIDPATLLYPQEFVDFLVGISSVCKPGGLAMISDYGTSERRDLNGEHEGALQLYGNSHSHGVNFSLFGALAGQVGWVALRTKIPFRSVHGVALRFADKVAARFRSAYHRAFVRGEDGEDLMDFRDIARGCFERKEWRTAARFYRRCLRLDPDNPQLLNVMGETCMEGGWHRVAYQALRHGQRIAPAAEWEFDFLLGRTCRALGRLDEAINWYHVSLGRVEHHVTLTNLAEIYQVLGRIEQGRDYVARAVELMPSYKRGVKLLAEIEADLARAAAAAMPTATATGEEANIVGGSEGGAT
jgi:tetratricopeptide (TPR) repeat protein